MTKTGQALIVIDMQNDCCHHDGVYNKHGLPIANISNIVPNIVETINFCQKMQIPSLSTKITVLEDLNNNAIGLGGFAKIRPFLEKEGFRENSWGHDLLDQLPKTNYSIRKWGISAFYNTELAKYLSSLHVKELILTGFTTNGSVETLAREALGRNYKIITLTDCVTTYSNTLNQASLTNLGSFGEILTSKKWFSSFENSI